MHHGLKPDPSAPWLKSADPTITITHLFFYQARTDEEAAWGLRKAGLKAEIQAIVVAYAVMAYVFMASIMMAYVVMVYIVI